MAIVRTIKVKQEDGSTVIHDIGANAANVILADDKTLETKLEEVDTVINSKISQDLTGANISNVISKPIKPLDKNGSAFYPVTSADQVKKADGTPLEVNGKLQIPDVVKVWSFTVPAANWTEETIDDVAMKKNIVAAEGMTVNTFLTSFQLDSVDAVNEDAKMAAMAWEYCDTNEGQIIFYSKTEITSDFHITAIEPIAN